MAKKISERRKRKYRREMLKLVKEEGDEPSTPQERIKAFPELSKAHQSSSFIWDDEDQKDENGRLGGSRKKGGKQRFNVPRSIS